MDLDLAVIIIPGILLWIPAMICGAKAEQIKRDNKLYTYRAVEAFMNGEDFDVMNERNQNAGRHWWAKFAVRLLFALVIGFCCGWGAISILERILF